MKTSCSHWEGFSPPCLSSLSLLLPFSLVVVVIVVVVVVVVVVVLYVFQGE